MTACKPQLMVLENSARFRPEVEVTVPLGAPLDKGPKGYHGDSLGALTRLAREKGFRRLAYRPSGTNASFLRDDPCPEVPAAPAGRAYRRKWDRSDDCGKVERSRADGVRQARRLDLPRHFLWAPDVSR